MDKKIRIGAFISGGGSNLQAIIDSCDNGRISGELAFVGSDNPKAYGLKRAAEFEIPSFVVDYPSIIREFKEDPSKVSLPADSVAPPRVISLSASIVKAPAPLSVLPSLRITS